MPKFNLGGIFKKKEPANHRETRVSISNQPVRASYNEDLEPMELTELARERDVKATSYPCHDFLEVVGIHDEFINLVETVGLSDLMLIESPQYLKLTNIFVQSYQFNDHPYHPTVEFMLYDQPRKMELSHF